MAMDSGGRRGSCLPSYWQRVRWISYRLSSVRLRCSWCRHEKSARYLAPFQLKLYKDKKFIADKDESFATVTDLDDASNLSDLGQLDPNFAFDAGDLSGSYALTNAWYVDQIPPFDVVIVAANEYGKAATMRIYGIEILNEGSGFSIDDLS